MFNKNAKRGRQSFIMLLWFKHCEKYAPILLDQIEDDFVRGHIIEGLNKMKASGYTEIVKKYTNDKTTWIKNQAKKYIENWKIKDLQLLDIFHLLSSEQNVQECDATKVK